MTQQHTPQKIHDTNIDINATEIISKYRFASEKKYSMVIKMSHVDILCHA